MRLFFLFLLMWAVGTERLVEAKNFNPRFDEWGARWITVPNQNPSDYGVYYFRRDFRLDSLPDSFPVYVSGDNRYKLYVNGQLMSAGPSRSDLNHWNYADINLAPCLKTGDNVVAAVVWNDGQMRPEANLSIMTAFLLQGADEQSAFINTGNEWKCIRDQAYSPIPVRVPGYYVSGPGERIDNHLHIADWASVTCDLSAWQNALPIFAAMPKERIGFVSPLGWLLQRSPLPESERSLERLARIRKAESVQAGKGFLKGEEPLIIPAHTHASIIIDNDHLTNAYMTLNFDGGDYARITLGYTEAFYEANDFRRDTISKGNRNEIEGKRFIGRTDTIISNGKNGQHFTTLAWRTYRYLMLTVETQNTPLIINDIYGTFTGFPLELKAQLYTDEVELQQMFEIGWRTARLCANETYMDCPFYEQLQYIGDSRIQALITLYNSGDDRLVRNFLNQIDQSRVPEGITQSRYPTASPQFIPPFSLWYVCSLHDYMMYGADTTFVAGKLDGIRQILGYFHRYQMADGSIRNMPWWNFYDWVNYPRWFYAPEGAADHCNAMGDLQLLLAYQAAARMESLFGLPAQGDIYTKRAEQLRQTIRHKYWCPERGLFADIAEHNLFSQHTNSLAILSGTATLEETSGIAQAMLTDKSLAPASIYFRFYLHQALVKAGLGNDYTKWLDKWRENLIMGLTTWGETSDVDATRSDCHAWGASPNIEIFRTILGIDSNAPGFQSVRIEPHLGGRTHIGGSIPHPCGKIRVDYTLDKKGKLTAQIELPNSIEGIFVWKGNTHRLKNGIQTLSFTENGVIIAKH